MALGNVPILDMPTHRIELVRPFFDPALDGVILHMKISGLDTVVSVLIQKKNSLNH